MTILPLPFLPFPPTAPPLGSTTAAREADGADPVAPTPSPTSRGLSPNTTVKIDGHPGRFRVRGYAGDAVLTVGLDGQGYQDAKIGKVARV